MTTVTYYSTCYLTYYRKTISMFTFLSDGMGNHRKNKAVFVFVFTDVQRAHIAFFMVHKQTNYVSMEKKTKVVFSYVGKSAYTRKSLTVPPLDVYVYQQTTGV